MSNEVAVDKLKKLGHTIKEHPLFIPTAATVMGGLILTFVIWLLGRVLSLNIFSSIVSFAKQTHDVPMWGLILIGIIPLALFGGIMITITYSRNKRKSTNIVGPDSKSYVEDIIYGMLCQWKYILDSAAIDEHSLLALCPKCKRELEPELDYRMRKYLKCPNCDFVSDTFSDNSLYGLKKRIISEIQGRIRNNEYKKDKQVNQASQPIPGCVPNDFDKQLRQNKRDPRW